MANFVSLHNTVSICSTVFYLTLFRFSLYKILFKVIEAELFLAFSIFFPIVLFRICWLDSLNIGLLW